MIPLYQRLRARTAWWGLLFPAILLIPLSGCLSHALSIAPDRNFLVIAHRGAALGECENTVPAFRKALAGGANALELDLSLTQDLVPVLWHDWNPDVHAVHEQTGPCAVVTQRGAIDRMTWAEFRRQGGYAGYFQDPDGHLWEVAWNPRMTIPD